MEYLTVSALNKYIRYRINNDSNLKQVYIKGEISNLKIHQKGNVFFTLKDEYSNIQALILDKRNYNDIILHSKGERDSPLNSETTELWLITICILSSPELLYAPIPKQSFDIKLNFGVFIFFSSIRYRFFVYEQNSTNQY